MWADRIAKPAYPQLLDRQRLHVLRIDRLEPHLQRKFRFQNQSEWWTSVDQCSCSVSIRQWTTHDEMIVAVHKHAYYVMACGSFDAERRGSGTG